MPLQFIGASTVVEAASGGMDLSEPAGAQQNDLLVACIGYRSNITFSPPSGWAAACPQQSSGDIDATSGIASCGMWWIKRGASAPATTFSRGGGDVARGYVVCYRPGSDEVVSLDVNDSDTLGASGNTPLTGPVTPTEDLTLLVTVIAAGDNHSTSNNSAASLPGAPTWRERADSTTATGADLGVQVADAHKIKAESTGNITATTSGNSRSAMGVAAFKTGYAGIKPNVLIDAEKTASTTNYTSASFTPTANALIILIAAITRADSDQTNAPAITDSAGLTWTQIDWSPDTTYGSSGQYDGGIGAWWAVAPSSPGSMTITVNPDGTPSHATHANIIEIVNGAATVSPIGGKASNSHADDTASLTLDATPLSSSLVLHARIYDTGTIGQYGDAHSDCVYLTNVLGATGGIMCQARFGNYNTSTAIAFADSVRVVTVAATDLHAALAFEVKKRTSSLLPHHNRRSPMRLAA